MEFSNHGNVQEKINRGLVDEYEMFEKLKTIQSKILAIPDKPEGLTLEDKKNDLDILNTQMSELNDVKLYITLNGDIRREIERRIQIMN